MFSWWEIVLAFYLALNLAGCMAFTGLMLILCEDNNDIDWEVFFNPYKIYKVVKVNWFGAWFLSVLAFLSITPIALIFYIYKLCTIGRR